jgi:hypothetical protein
MRRGACENEAVASRPAVVQSNPQFGRRAPSCGLGMSLLGSIVGLNWAPFVLADVELQDVVPVKPGYALRQVAIICGAAMLVTLPVILWAVFVRKPRRRHHHHYHHHIQRRAAANSVDATLLDDSDSTVEAEESSPKNRRRIWKRRRRRDHRPINPTLAQTGGLPPVRTRPPAKPSA